MKRAICSSTETVFDRSEQGQFSNPDSIFKKIESNGLDCDEVTILDGGQNTFQIVIHPQTIR
jgi:hypothetical protein